MATGLYNWSRTPSANATSTYSWAEGMAPSAVNDSARGDKADVAQFRDDIAGAIVTAGTSTAYTVSSYQVFTTLALMNGMVIAFTPHTTSGATVTLNVDGLGAKPLRSAPSVELPAGVLIQGTPYTATYNNSDSAWYLHGFYGNPYSVPIGGLLDFIGTTAPNSSFVFPFGQAISRTTYAALFTLVSATYGAGDGSTTFNVPDLRGRARFGKDDMGGSAAGRVTTAGSSLDGTSLGASGGLQNRSIAQANLPASPPLNPTVTITDPGHLHGPPSGTGGYLTLVGGQSTGRPVGSDMGLSTNTGTATTGITAALNGNLGSGTALAIMPPAIILPCLLRVI